VDLHQSSLNTYDLHEHGFINSLIQACLCQQTNQSWKQSSS